MPDRFDLDDWLDAALAHVPDDDEVGNDVVADEDDGDDDGDGQTPW